MKFLLNCITMQKQQFLLDYTFSLITSYIFSSFQMYFGGYLAGEAIPWNSPYNEPIQT